MKIKKLYIFIILTISLFLIILGLILLFSNSNTLNDGEIVKSLICNMDMKSFQVEYSISYSEKNGIENVTENHYYHFDSIDSYLKMNFSGDQYFDFECVDTFEKDNKVICSKKIENDKNNPSFIYDKFINDLKKSGYSCK